MTVGWDSSPRVAQNLPFTKGKYPRTPTWDQSPSEFKAALAQAREFIERHGSPHPVLTINAWNEWTEGSYLLPDTHNGLVYLEAVKQVFGIRAERTPAPLPPPLRRAKNDGR